MATTKNPGVLWNVSQTLETEDKTRARNNIGAVSADDVSTAISGKVDDTDYATSSAYGIVKLGSDTVQSTAAETVTSTTGRTYAVQKNANGQLLVNVPWTDSQSVGDGTLTINQGGTQLGTFTANQSTPSTINVQSYLVSAGNGIYVGSGTAGNTTTYTVGVNHSDGLMMTISTAPALKVKAGYGISVSSDGVAVNAGTGLAINSQDKSLYVSDPIPAHTSSDLGKALSLNSSNEPYWRLLASGSLVNQGVTYEVSHVAYNLDNQLLTASCYQSQNTSGEPLSFPAGYILKNNHNNFLDNLTLADYCGSDGVYGWEIMTTTPPGANNAVSFNALVLIDKLNDIDSNRRLDNCVAAYLSVIDRGNATAGEPPTKTCVFNSITSYVSEWGLYATVDSPVNGQYTSHWYIATEDSTALQFTRIRLIVLGNSSGVTIKQNLTNNRRTSVMSSANLVMKCSKTPYRVGAGGVGSLNTPIFINSDGTFAECQISGGQSDSAKSLLNTVSMSGAVHYGTIEGEAVPGHVWLRLTDSGDQSMTSLNHQTTLTTQALTIANSTNDFTSSLSASELSIQSNGNLLTTIEGQRITLSPTTPDGTETTITNSQISMMGNTAAAVLDADSLSIGCTNTNQATVQVYNSARSVGMLIQGNQFKLFEYGGKSASPSGGKTIIESTSSGANTAYKFNGTANSAEKWNGYSIQVVDDVPGSWAANTIYFI